MRIQIKLTYLQTLLFVLLPITQMIFNNSETQGKCIAKEDISKPKTSKTYFFGQNRIQAHSQNSIHSEQQVKELFLKDWSDYNLKTVVIDPGHGGKDTGASTSDGVKEKDIALSISKKLGTYITANYPKVKVVYTRKSDVFLSLKKRAEIANKNEADLFISIHCNSFSKSTVRGTETYILGLHKADENMAVIKRENDVVKLEENYQENYEEYGVDKNSPLYEILMNSYQNAYLEQSLSFAQNLDKKLKANGKKSRGVHQAGFVVLKRAAMPSVLIETGYLTNPTDKTMLNSEKGQKNMAYNIYTAFAAYKKSIEKPKVSPSSSPPLSQLPSTNTAKSASPPSKTETKEPKKKSNIIFAIQVASVEKKLTLGESKWRLIKDRVVIEKSKDGLLRYLVMGYDSDYQKALAEKELLKKRGFTGCFIVAYKDERRVELYKARKELGYK